MSVVRSRMRMRAAASMVVLWSVTMAATVAKAEGTLEAVSSSDLVINGVTVNADGRLFLPTIDLSDTDKSRILTISPEGKVATLIADPRLSWVDAMWIDEQGNLLMPASQRDRTAGLNGGTNAVKPPITLYRLAIGARGVRR